jgi:methylenetetrahydrofolate dehydrogenase (NADP+)/methenyltetrahydrofolate cyclohydrolase
MIIFNGKKLASFREAQLKQKIASDFSDKALIIAAVFFTQDAGSSLYTNLKSEAASRVGVDYQSHEFSLSDSIITIQNKIEELNSNPNITGIIIQKPWRKTWLQVQTEATKASFNQDENPKNAERIEFTSWWNKLTDTISESKDVDGLHPNTIAQIKAGTWKDHEKVLPATCQAVLTILDTASQQLSNEYDLETTKKIFDGKYIIIGKSDLLGIPLFYELKRQGKDVEILASAELNKRMQSGQKLLDATVVVSATGTKGLVTGDMVSDNVIIVDVGEPKADVNFDSVSKKAAFITPVPGGVGPMTVVSLLENCVKLAI